MTSYRYSEKYRASRWVAAVLCLPLMGFAAIAQVSRAAVTAASPTLPIKPYKVLLVVEHGSDPYDLVVTSETDRFQPVAALLKAWSVPFDILRLDQQHLDASYLFRRSGHIRYGTVIWLADLSSYDHQNLASLAEATQAGTSVIAIGSRVLDPTLNKLLGLQFKEFYTSTETFHLARAHYITRNIATGKNSLPALNNDFDDRLWMQPTQAEVLLTQGPHPVVTINQLAPGTSAVWLGTPSVPKLCSSMLWRNLFFRSLVWSLGYAIVPNVDYSHRVIFELDDWGTADKGFLSYWSYIEPSEETIRQYLIAPLERHHAVASLEVNTGYVDRKSKRILSPWVQNFTDRWGRHQDYASTRKGILAAIDAGVVNIESHGWDHMDPDLDSPPGPWWSADIKGEASVDGWYSEFADHRRDKDIAAATQIYHMERSLEYLQHDFGKQALELKPGNNGWSKSQFTHTAGLASRAGFGMFHGDSATYYIDHELALDMADVIPDFGTGYDRLDDLHPQQWPDHPDGPVILGFHDRDIALDHNFLEQLFAALPAGYHTIATNRYIAILHTQVSSEADNDGLQLTFTPDSHYCIYFAKHPSSWKLWLSDPLRQQLAASHPEVSIDNKPAMKAAGFQETMTIDLPAGLGSHTWKLVAAGDNR